MVTLEVDKRYKIPIIKLQTGTYRTQFRVRDMVTFVSYYEEHKIKYEDSKPLVRHPNYHPGTRYVIGTIKILRKVREEFNYNNIILYKEALRFL